MKPNEVQQRVGLPLGARPLSSPSLRGEHGAFKHLLETESSKVQLRYSSHASQRIESRGIQLSESQELRLASGVDALRAKGVRDGLVVVDELRFVVSAQNKTVITVMSDRDREVYTNIQGVAFE